MEIIGQNGNDGEHYSEYDLNKDGIIDVDEKKEIEKEIKKLIAQKSQPFSSWRLNKINNEISYLKSLLEDEDDETIIY